MELGEILFAMSQKIAGYAKTEFDGCGIPLSLRPVIMECASKQIVQDALDNVIAGKFAAKSTQKPEAKEAAEGQRPGKKTRSGVGIDSLKQSLDEDFGRSEADGRDQDCNEHKS